MNFINLPRLAGRYVVYAKGDVINRYVEDHATSYAATHEKVVLNDHELRNGRPAIYDVYDRGPTN